MTLDELKAQLDPSLGDETRFDALMPHLRRLSESDFADVAKTALEVPFRNKREGLSRLKRLHATTATMRMKERHANHSG